ncbi:hypothetical protein G9A89_023359 [Geosiphon pyriformis]|nr:hypothetical protein G9A89_023359 [Geosiphon pyriformis]
MEMAEPLYLSISQEVRTDKLDLKSHEKEISNAQIAKRAELDEELKHLVIPMTTELGKDATADDVSLEDNVYRGLLKPLTVTIMISPMKNELEKSYNFEDDDTMKEITLPILSCFPIAMTVAGKQLYDLDIYPPKVEEKTNHEETEIIPFPIHEKGPSALHTILIAIQNNIFDKDDNVEEKYEANVMRNKELNFP